MCGIGFVTPVKRHLQNDRQMLKARSLVYEKVKANNITGEIEPRKVVLFSA